MWPVKNRQPLLNGKTREVLSQHMLDNAKSKNILVDSISVCPEHVHCLFRLNNDQSPNMIIQLIKGESALWINKNIQPELKFEWDKEFIAVSIGESQVDQVRDYIKYQIELHPAKSFEDEYNEFILRYKFEVPVIQSF
jgi:putative transposase